MTQVKTRKQRVMFTVEQKLDYVKLMVNEGYTNRQIIDISSFCSTVNITRCFLVFTCVIY